MSSLNIITIGTGMYVCGRGTNGYGTILPAISEWKRRGNSISYLNFVGSSISGGIIIQEKINELEGKTGLRLGGGVFPVDGQFDPFAYRRAIEQLPGPGCAIVVVPDHMHYQVTKYCLEAGLHTLVVKPFTPTVAEGRELINIANANGLYGAVEFHKRWDRANLMMRDRIQNGDLGDLLYCWVEYSQRKSIPQTAFKEWCEESNILQYLGVHYIDIMRFVTSAVPKRVMAVGQKTWLPSQGINSFDSIQCIIEWEMPSGKRFTETILTNWIDPETSSSMSDQKIKVVGTQGRYESDQKERGIRINVDGQGMEHVNPDFCMAYGTGDGKVTWHGYGIESVCTFLDDVVALHSKKVTLNDLKSIRPTFSEALVSTAVLEAAQSSLSDDSSWKQIENVWR